MHLVKENFTGFVYHHADQADFYSLWQSADFWQDALSPDQEAFRQANAYVLSEEIAQQHQAMIRSGPGATAFAEYNWDRLIESYLNNPGNELIVGLENRAFNDHLIETDLGLRMINFLEDYDQDIPEFPILANDIRATGNLTLAYAMAGTKNFQAAYRYLQDTVDFIHENSYETLNPWEEVHFSDDSMQNQGQQSFYDTHGIGLAKVVLRFNEFLRYEAENRPGQVDLSYQGEQLSLARKKTDCLKAEDYQAAAAFQRIVHEHIDAPLKSQTDDIQIFTAGKLLAMYLIEGLPNIDYHPKDRIFYISGNNTTVNLARERITGCISVTCPAEYVPKVESVLHKNRYSMVFPRFYWDIEDIDPPKPKPRYRKRWMKKKDL